MINEQKKNLISEFKVYKQKKNHLSAFFFIGQFILDKLHTCVH